jgi:hypothetical protein
MRASVGNILNKKRGIWMEDDRSSRLRLSHEFAGTLCCIAGSRPRKDVTASVWREMEHQSSSVLP